MNYELSEKEMDFVNIMNEVGCMSVYEASMILNRYMALSENQIIKMINHLRNNYYIDVVGNENYIVAGNRSKKQAEKPNKGRIVAMRIALDRLAADNEPFDTMKYIFVESGSDIVFLSGGIRYDVYCLKYDDIYKCTIIQDKYIKKNKRLNNDRCNKNLGTNETVYLVFDDIDRSEEILEKMGELELEIPYKILILHEKFVSKNITYDMYEKTV